MVNPSDDAPPLVRILAASLARAAARPNEARRMRRLHGRVGLRSTTGPQAATVDFAGGVVHVTPGVGHEVDVLIEADLDTMGRPGAPRPKVSGVIRHPRLALGAGQVLDARPPGGWPGAVDALWDWAEGQDGRPGLLRVVCSDDGAEHVAGQHGGTRVEVHGPAWALLAVFTGADHLGAAVMKGRVQVLADFAAVSRFVGVLTRYMLGEEGGGHAA
jgi:hypothetical protein